MNARLIDLLPELAVAGLIGAGLAAFVLRPVFDRIRSARAWWVQLAAAAAGVALVLPATVLIFEQTRYFTARGLTEVGSAAFEEPPMSETGARALEDALRPGETWASVTRLGRCADVDLYLFYWLAFRLIPNPPDCARPDVEVFWKVAPPPGAEIVARGSDYAIVARR